MMSLVHILILTGCIIVVNGQYGGRSGRPTHGRPTLPPRCARVGCVRLDCPNPTTPPGQCCPVCPPTVPPHCAAMLCVRPDCPNPTIPPGQCCPVCPPTVPPHCAAVLCLRPDCPNPTTPPGQCCPVCPVQKPGQCPHRPGPGICVSLCTGDFSCPGNQKCCSNGCGHTCTAPVGGGKCDGITCPQLRCANQYKPPGRCCPICRPIGKPDCRNVACTMEYCDNQYTPPGQCCPVCPPNTY